MALPISYVRKTELLVKNIERPHFHNSKLQSLNAPVDDSRLKKEFYKRTSEQNDELGLNDMKTENYSELEIINECE